VLIPSLERCGNGSPTKQEIGLQVLCRQLIRDSWPLCRSRTSGLTREPSQAPQRALPRRRAGTRLTLCGHTILAQHLLLRLLRRRFRFPSHRPPDAESVSASESEQSETGSAVTLLELDRRSRSASPFTYVGPVRQRTVSRVTGMGSFDDVGADFVVQQAGNGGPVVTVEGQNPQSSVLTLSSPPLAKSSGNNSTQKLIHGDRSPVASGAKFFTSAFSKVADI
jgi:hypothetical protein